MRGFHLKREITVWHETSSKIILSDQIQPSAFARIGVTGKEQIRQKLTQGNKTFLQLHHQTFEKQLFI